MIHIPILLDGDPTNVVGVGTLADSSAEMVISVKNQALLATIRKMAEQGGFRAMSLSIEWSEVKPKLEQTDLVVYRRDRFVAHCCICGFDIDLLEEKTNEKIRDHAKEHGARDIMMEEKFSTNVPKVITGPAYVPGI